MFGGAMVYEGVRMTAEYRGSGTGWRHRSWFADPYVLLRWALRTLVLRRPQVPFPQCTVRLAGMGELSGPMRLLAASTLEMRCNLYNPFAARGTGPVRITAIADRAPPMWRLLPALFRGRFDGNMNAAGGILSGRGERAELLGISGYALDGEIFTVDPSRPVIFAAGVTLRVLRP
jgi:hypothetical protein